MFLCVLCFKMYKKQQQQSVAFIHEGMYEIVALSPEG